LGVFAHINGGNGHGNKIHKCAKVVVQGCKNASTAKSQEHLKYKEVLGKDAH
jgi:hypothetical protein